MKTVGNYVYLLLGPICVAIAGVVWNVLQAPSALGGRGLPVLAGLERDPYLLTSAHVASPQSVHILSAALLGLCAIAVGFGAASFAARLKLSVGTVSSAIVVFSPFALGVVVDPLGPGLCITMLLCVVMLFDVLRIVRNMPVLVQSLLCAAAAIHDGALILPTLAYAAIVGYRGGKNALALVLTATVTGVATRTLVLGEWTTHSQGDFTGPLTAVATAFCVFIILPLALFAVKKRLYEKTGLQLEGLFPALALTASIALSGIVSFVGDPSAYWLAAEAAILLAAASAVRWDAVGVRFATVFAAVLVCLTVSIHTALAPAFASQVASTEASAVHTALLQYATSSTERVCVTGGDLDVYRSLSGRAFSDVYGFGTVPLAPSSRKCIEQHALPSAIVILQNAHARVIDNHAMSLVRALKEDERNHRVDLDQGSLLPKTPIRVRGHGAFIDTINTEIGNAPSLTVIAGFAYAVPCSVAYPSRLTFAAANPLAASPHVDPVRFDVSIISAGGQVRLIAKTLQSQTHVSSPEWNYYSVALPQHRRCSQLKFAATAPTGHAMATWVTFVAPALK